VLEWGNTNAFKQDATTHAFCAIATAETSADVQGNGSVTVGAVTIECCPPNHACTARRRVRGKWSDGLGGIEHVCCSPECHDRIFRQDSVGDATCANQYARDWEIVTGLALRPEEQRGWRVVATMRCRRFKICPAAMVGSA
jgi:hypothetical protein